MPPALPASSVIEQPAGLVLHVVSSIPTFHEIQVCASMPTSRGRTDAKLWPAASQTRPEIYWDYHMRMHIFSTAQICPPNAISSSLHGCLFHTSLSDPTTASYIHIFGRCRYMEFSPVSGPDPNNTSTRSCTNPQNVDGSSSPDGGRSRCLAVYRTPSHLLSNPPSGEYIKGIICQLTTSKQSDMIFWTFTHWFMDSKDEVDRSCQSLFRRLGGQKKKNF